MVNKPLELTQLSSFKLLIDKPRFRKEFKKQSNDRARILYILKTLHDYGVLSLTKDEKAKKNPVKSQYFRKLGNNLNNSCPTDGNKCFEAFQCYSQSIAYAPCDSLELATSYEKRSTVLFKMGKYKECLKDLDRVIHLNFSKILTVKLYTRKIDCLLMIGENVTTKTWKEIWLNRFRLVDSKKEKILPSKIKEIPKRGEELPKIVSANAEAPCATDAVTIKHNARYGRHLVANRTIQPGEVICVEKAFSTVLYPENIYSHCFHCLERAWSSLPCDYCTCVMYCSMKCKIKDWQMYHRIECPILNDFFRNELIEPHLLWLRMVLQAINEFNNLGDLRNALDRIDRCNNLRTRGFDNDKKLQSHKYGGIYILETHRNEIPLEEMWRFTVDVCYMLNHLARFTPLFKNEIKNIFQLMSNDDVLFVGTLLLKHALLTPINTYVISEMIMSTEPKDVDLAGGISPFFCLFSHSCDPNVFQCSKGNKMITYAIQPIKKDELLCISYGSTYLSDTKIQRQEMLYQRYFFNCECLACKYDWPLRDSLASFMDQVKNIEIQLKFTTTVVMWEGCMEFGVNEKPIEIIIRDSLKLLKELYKYLPRNSKEIAHAVSSLSYFYSLTGNRFEIPTVKIPLIKTTNK